MTSQSFQDWLDPANFHQFYDLSSYPGLDMKVFMDSQRKNMQVANQVQQKLIDVMQSAGKIQMQIMGDLVDNTTTLLKEASAEAQPEDKIARQSQLSQKAYEKTVKNMNALADLTSETKREFSEIFQKRFSSALHEMTDSVKGGESKKAA